MEGEAASVQYRGRPLQNKHKESRGKCDLAGSKSLGSDILISTSWVVRPFTGRQVASCRALTNPPLLLWKDWMQPAMQLKTGCNSRAVI